MGRILQTSLLPSDSSPLSICLPAATVIFRKLRSEPVGQHQGWFLIGENFLVCIRGPVQPNLLCSLVHPTQACSERACRALGAFLKCPIQAWFPSYGETKVQSD